MQSSRTANRGVKGSIDRWIDAAFSVASDASPFDRRPTLRAFEQILLMHLAARLWLEAFPESSLSSFGQTALKLLISLCFAMLFVKRLAPLAIGGAFCVMLVALWGTFPMTSNHLFLELWILLLLVIIGRQKEEEARVGIAAIRWSVAIVLFYTGFQKVLYGAYFSGQFLLIEMIAKPDFGAAISWMLPAEEWARLRTMLPDDVGDGPYKTNSLLFLVAANIVYAFEMSVPALLLWKRSRQLGIGLVFLFVIAIEVGAREVFFAALMANLMLLFWPTDVHRRAIPIFAAGYVLFGALRAFSIGGLV